MNKLLWLCGIIAFAVVSCTEGNRGSIKERIHSARMTPFLLDVIPDLVAVLRRIIGCYIRMVL